MVIVHARDEEDGPKMGLSLGRATEQGWDMGLRLVSVTGVQRCGMNSGQPVGLTLSPELHPPLFTLFPSPLPNSSS